MYVYVLLIRIISHGDSFLVTIVITRGTIINRNANKECIKYLVLDHSVMITIISSGMIGSYLDHLDFSIYGESSY